MSLEEKALQFAPKALSLGCSLQYWGSEGSLSRGNAIFSLVTRANFCKAVMMWGGSILENEFLIFWLACLEVAISLRVIRPTSSDARFVGCGWMMSCMSIILPFVCVCVCV